MKRFTHENLTSDDTIGLVSLDENIYGLGGRYQLLLRKMELIAILSKMMMDSYGYIEIRRIFQRFFVKDVYRDKEES